MAKETILNRAGSSAIDCILPFASKCAIGVSTYCRKFPMAKIEEPKVTPERLMQFGFDYAPPLIISAAVARKQEGPRTEVFSELVENIIPMSYGSAQALADHLKLADATNEVRVLDLGSGSGIWGIVLAQKSPRVQVTAVDWAGMIPTT